MKNTPVIILCFLCTLFINSINAQDTCKSEDSDLIDDLSSITKCTIEEVKPVKNHYRKKRSNRVKIVVSAKKRAHSLSSFKNTAKLSELKRNTDLVSKLEIRNRESLINKLPFNAVEVKPLFKDCASTYGKQQTKCFDEQLAKHIQKNLKYPQRALWHRMEGRVLVQFIIDKEGNVANIQVKGPENSYLLEKEAKRVISKLPKFIPGKVDGKNIHVNKGVPITFKLPSKYAVAKKTHKSLDNILDFNDVDKIPTSDSCKDSEGDNLACFNKQMIEHIQANFKYPKSASEDGIEGKVQTTFVINKKGNISNIQVLGPKNGRILERAAKRLIEKLPKFSPALKEGKSVNVKYNIPIDFKLS